MNLEIFRFMISSIVNESDVKFKLNLSIKNNFQDGGLFASVCLLARSVQSSKQGRIYRIYQGSNKCSSLCYDFTGISIITYLIVP